MSFILLILSTNSTAESSLIRPAAGSAGDHLFLRHVMSHIRQSIHLGTIANRHALEDKCSRPDHYAFAQRNIATDSSAWKYRAKLTDFTIMSHRAVDMNDG